MAAHRSATFETGCRLNRRTPCAVEGRMNRTLMGMALAVAMVGATAARADDFREYHGAVPAAGARGCATSPGYPQQPQQGYGRYEWQTVQRWVPAQTAQVWVEGRCVTKRHGRRGRFEHTRCLPGRYETVTTPGRYETTQDWVWVAYSPPVRQGATYGATWNGGTVTGGFEVSMR
jgi:hypothetical protein